MTTILSVTALTEAIKAKLESGFASLKVQGEVSNLKIQASGHVYFTLKDEKAQISAVLFRGYSRNLSRPLKNGDKLVIHGEINVYAPRGAYQLIARQVEFTGMGELLMQLHALKTKLENLGWFSQEGKQKIPTFPKTIGVVTSGTGAVIQDILHILSRRLENFHLVLYPVKVQGEGAAKEIATAIAECNRHKVCDVLIVGRGGGSLEDLWAFNEEIVATAIHESSIPIISAVGHETDFSISDFVADLRAPTPSAAAEIVSAERSRQIQFLSQAKERIKGALRAAVHHHKTRLQAIQRHPLFARPLSMLEPHYQRLDDLSSTLDAKIQTQIREKQMQLVGMQRQAVALQPRRQILMAREKLAGIATGLQRSISHYLELKTSSLKALASHLQGINPEELLKKGYCILFEENSSSVILSVNQLKEGDSYLLKMGDGSAKTTVTQVDR